MTQSEDRSVRATIARGDSSETEAGREPVASPPPQVPTRGRERAVDWRVILAGASPREVLARLMNGDPLGLAVVVEQRLRVHAYLLDADRVFLRAAARCARLAVR